MTYPSVRMFYTSVCFGKRQVGQSHWALITQVDDLVLFASTVKKLYSSKTPMFLGGHSMGSLASIHVALRDQAQWDGLVLGTATVDVEWSWTLRWISILDVSIHTVWFFILYSSFISQMWLFDVESSICMTIDIVASIACFYFHPLYPVSDSVSPFCYSQLMCHEMRLGWVCKYGVESYCSLIMLGSFGLCCCYCNLC